MKKILNITLLLACCSALLISCSKKDDPDPCESIICLNDGKCINGVCDCPQGYTGADCGTQKTPSKMYISKISVTNFPSLDDNGGSWDFGSGPDIYIALLKDNQLVWSSNVYYENASTNATYDFTPDNEIEISSPKLNYELHIFDYDDLDDDDWMAGINFTPYVGLLGFPKTRTLDVGTFATELKVSYEW